MIISYTFVTHKCYISNYHEKQAHIYTIYQSQKIGPAYWPVVAIPSGWNVVFGDNHDYQSYEMNANYLSFMYFNKNVKGFYKTANEYSQRYYIPNYCGWHFEDNPLDVIDEYVDYRNIEQMKVIKHNTSLRLHFWNYLLPILPNF